MPREDQGAPCPCPPRGPGRAAAATGLHRRRGGRPEHCASPAPGVPAEGALATARASPELVCSVLSRFRVSRKAHTVKEIVPTHETHTCVSHTRDRTEPLCPVAHAAHVEASEADTR